MNSTSGWLSNSAANSSVSHGRPSGIPGGHIEVRKSRSRCAFLRFSSDIEERHLLPDEVRHGDQLGLDVGAGELHPEGDAQVVGPGRLKRQPPDGHRVKPAGPFLHVAPVAAGSDRRQKAAPPAFPRAVPASPSPLPGGEGRSAFFPRVAHQPQSEVLDVPVRRRGRREGQPAFVLLNPKWPLVRADFAPEALTRSRTGPNCGQVRRHA